MVTQININIQQKATARATWYNYNQLSIHEITKCCTTDHDWAESLNRNTHRYNTNWALISNPEWHWEHVFYTYTLHERRFMRIWWKFCWKMILGFFLRICGSRTFNCMKNIPKLTGSCTLAALRVIKDPSLCIFRSPTSSSDNWNSFSLSGDWPPTM